MSETFRDATQTGRNETDASSEETPGEALPARLQPRDSIGGMLRYQNIPPELAEALRATVNRYELRNDQQLPSTVAVTSALHGEGVTTASQALSTILAQETGRYVCWVDCSWLAPVAGGSDDGDRPSLIDILADRSDVLAAFQSSPDLPELVSLRPGPVPEAMRNVIARSPEFGRLLDLLAAEFDHVVFDLPPILANATGLTLVRRADVSLFVVRHRTTSLTQLARALEATQPTPNLGVILNRFRSRVPGRIRSLLPD